MTAARNNQRISIVMVVPSARTESPREVSHTFWVCDKELKPAITSGTEGRISHNFCDRGEGPVTTSVTKRRGQSHLLGQRGQSHLLGQREGASHTFWDRGGASHNFCDKEQESVTPSGTGEGSVTPSGTEGRGQSHLLGQRGRVSQTFWVRGASHTFWDRGRGQSHLLGQGEGPVTPSGTKGRGQSHLLEQRRGVSHTFCDRREASHTFWDKGEGLVIPSGTEERG